MVKLTASRECLLHEASAIEQSAKDSLNAWILLGQSQRFGEEMAKVDQLRRIAEIKSIRKRRFLIRELGYTV